ncbi:hypothetical protein KP509_28G048500 [Ceratopteris richardii]|uniref:Myb/SANT-like DNA-binding domain-containing protein n=1 Tax=Ceratopteris richardii TaxID=49495 RepID=A0A8T2RC00_CERRI|nr:hypothetical protein KP509_28G048500 [Ceratopteris richardii]
MNVESVEMNQKYEFLSKQIQELELATYKHEKRKSQSLPPPCGVNANGTLNSSCLATPSPLEASQTKPPRKSTKRKEDRQDESLHPREPIAKKGKTTKRKIVVELGDEEDGKKSKWKDHWVDQLIHIRGGMSEEFNNPSKQGVNLWAKVSTKLASTYPDFDKDSEACQKKWAKVLGQYRQDKAHNSILANDRKITCKCFDVVDEYYHTRPIVTPFSNTSLSANVSNDNGGSGSELHEGEPIPLPSSSSRRSIPKWDESLAGLVDNGKDLIHHFKEMENKHGIFHGIFPLPSRRGRCPRTPTRGPAGPLGPPS